MIDLIALNNLMRNTAAVGYRNEANKHWNAGIFFTILSIIGVSFNYKTDSMHLPVGSFG
jgi:hypothetical protein